MHAHPKFSFSYKFFNAFFLILVMVSGYSQTTKKAASISGVVYGENDLPLSGVSIQVLGKTGGTFSNADGKFNINVPSGKAFALVFTHLGYRNQQKSFWLNLGEEEQVSIFMAKGSQELNTVVVTEQRSRKEAGLVVLNPKAALNIPTALGGIESMIKVLVGSNNELSSQYSVRGGNYDENLVYVNDFEVFRPYLVRSGQQEGLSFINPEMTRNVNFYNGGFQARYGDKMSSVLDIQYKKPKKFGGSAYVSLLEQGIHFEGTDRKNSFTYLIGVRNRSNRSLVGSQATKGNYVPSSSDLQALLTWQPNDKHSFEWLSNLSFTGFRLQPAFSQLTSSVFSPYFSANLGLDILFEGEESDGYRTLMNGLSWNYQPRKNLKLKFMASRFEDRETESIDIIGAYLFGEREFDKSKADFGLIKNPLGSGLFLNHARNYLDIGVWNFSHKGSLDQGKHFIQWGLTAEKQQISDKLHEWEYKDSAGYNIPFNPDQLVMSRFLKSKIDLMATRLSGYVQDNLLLNKQSDFSIQAGIRFNYNNLNNELLLSPRMGVSWKPSTWNRNVIFRGAAGLYHQPPFYRELRGYDGAVNSKLKSQKSWQLTGGFDYSFKMGDRPLRLTTEAYYKNMWDVVPYDLDNVRIRYSGKNEAKAYATGIETRLFGELVKDAESWISIGFMKTGRILPMIVTTTTSWIHWDGQTIAHKWKEVGFGGLPIASLPWASSCRTIFLPTRTSKCRSIYSMAVTCPITFQAV